MIFLKESKTNWKYILIVVILAVVVSGGILWWVAKEEIKMVEEKVMKETYIKVIVPNGGEKLRIGETYKIKWEFREIEKIDISLYGLIPGQRPFSKQLATGVSASLGEYSWLVSEDIPSGNSFVIIISQEGEVYPRDESDNYFSIIKDETVVKKKTEPYIKVISPNGEERWVAGKNYSIKVFCSEGVNDFVTVVLLDKRGGYFESCLEGSGLSSCMISHFHCKANQTIEFIWNIPQHIKTGEKVFKVSLFTGMGWSFLDDESDESDNYFSIIHPVE